MSITLCKSKMAPATAAEQEDEGNITLEAELGSDAGAC